MKDNLLSDFSYYNYYRSFFITKVKRKVGKNYG